MNAPNETVYAYIDAANLEKGVARLGWKLDYARFRKWLTDKYDVKIAYLFMGMILEYADIYSEFQKAGFVLIFKEAVRHKSGAIKSNCDTDLVLQATRDAFESPDCKAVLVSSDGDFACLVRFLKSRSQFKMLISPDQRCSYLLRKLYVPTLYLNTQMENVCIDPKKEKALDGDKTP